MLKIAICDDNKVFRGFLKENIQSILSSLPKVTFYEMESGEELLRSPCENYDMLFLDMQLRGKMDGRATAVEFRKRNMEAELIICTGTQYPEPDDFKQNVLRFLLKSYPHDKMHSELREIFSKVLDKKVLVFKGKYRDIKVLSKEIYYFVISSRKVRIVTAKCGIDSEEPLLTTETLQEIYEKVKGLGFEYAHNSYIVNLRHIISNDRRAIIMRDNAEINVTRTRKEKFWESFMQFCDDSR